MSYPLKGLFVSSFVSQYYSLSPHPQAVLVFLHGYNNTRQDMLPVYHYLLEKCPNLAICAPEGNISAQNDTQRKRWYRLAGFDTEHKRMQQDTPIAEIVEIYNRAAPNLSQTADELNEYLDQIQKIYGFTDQNTFLGGFSQGAMLALWTALSRKHKLAGVFSLAGLAAADSFLKPKISAKPKIYLMHGEADPQVRIKCLTYTSHWLEQNRIENETFRFDGLGHEISTSELEQMARVINAA